MFPLFFYSTKKCMNINVCELDTSVHHSIWPVYIAHTTGDIRLKLHKEERSCFKIAQRQLADIALICVLHNTHSS